MYKKAIPALLILMLIIPLSPLLAEDTSQWNIREAVQLIKENDKGKAIRGKTVELSITTRQYQSDFSRDLEKLQQEQQAYEDKREELQIEMEAWRSLYDYWYAAEALKVSEANLEKAENEWELARARRESGLVTEAEVLRAQMSVNNAKAAYESAAQQAQMLKLGLNQKLGNEYTQELTLESVAFALLPEKDYRIYETFRHVRSYHPSVQVAETAIRTYDKILDEMKTVLGIHHYPARDQTEKLEERLEELREQREAALEAGDEETASQLSEQINQVRKQRNQVMGQYQQAEVQTYIAEKELTEYYRLEKEKTEVGLSQQLDQLEMRIFRFAEQFDRLKNQIGLYEENLGLAQKLYDHAVTAFNEGTATAERMEQARLGLLDAELQLLGAQKDYLILKEEFRLFKEGL